MMAMVMVVDGHVNSDALYLPGMYISYTNMFRHVCMF